jgi:murein DD-endopeptidase MepM/ murein hydrolase activator NlpD
MASLIAILDRHRADFHPVVPFDTTRDRLFTFDFTENNTGLSSETIANTDRFATWINNTLHQHHARYGIGGYGEHRTLYARSAHFDQPAQQTAEPAAAIRPTTAKPLAAAIQPTGSGQPARSARAGSEAPRTENVSSTTTAAETESRRLHLGVDIWGPTGTKVMAPLDGIVHSFAFNNNDSDYGATLILTHRLEGVGFHTLYGHLSLNSLKNLHEGQLVSKGDVIAEFGMRFENGNWPPHLHFQVIADMQGWKGDYPGVCRFSERMQWLANCPDPNIILQML